MSAWICRQSSDGSRFDRAGLAFRFARPCDLKLGLLTHHLLGKRLGKTMIRGRQLLRLGLEAALTLSDLVGFGLDSDGVFGGLM